MNINSLTQSSYQAQLQSSNNSVQSQSASSSWSPETTSFSSMLPSADYQLSALLNIRSAPVDTAVFSNAAQQLASGKSDRDGDNDAGSEGGESTARRGLQQAFSQLRLQGQPQASTSSSSGQDFQSMLMKNILSAYGVSNATSNAFSLQA